MRLHAACCEHGIIVWAWPSSTMFTNRIKVYSMSHNQKYVLSENIKVMGHLEMSLFLKALFYSMKITLNES